MGKVITTRTFKSTESPKISRRKMTMSQGQRSKIRILKSFIMNNLNVGLSVEVLVWVGVEENYLQGL